MNKIKEIIMTDDSDNGSKEPPPGKKLICRAYITLRNGKRLYANSCGKKAFCFYVDI